MASPAVAFYLAFLIIGNTVSDPSPAQTTNIKSPPLQHDKGVITIETSETLTLQCFFEGEVPPRQRWYKQSFGQKPRLISIYYKYEGNASFFDEFENNPRFSLDVNHGNNHLTISDLNISDSATYFCMNSFLYIHVFSASFTVIVKVPGSNIKTLVHQSSSPSVQPGGSVTLSCSVHTGTCDEEHSVYWFKQAEESHPGLLYTSGSRTDRCESNSTSCVYNLSMKSLNRSHAGTYYCAVASCGHILFGNGTKLDINDDFMAYFWKGAFAFSTILSVILAFSVFMMSKSKSYQPPDSGAGLARHSKVEGCQPTESLYFATVSVNLSNRSGRQRDPTWTETVYYCVKK